MYLRSRALAWEPEFIAAAWLSCWVVGQETLWGKHPARDLVCIWRSHEMAFTECHLMQLLRALWRWLYCRGILTVISGIASTVSSMLKWRRGFFNQIPFSTKAHLGCMSVFHHCSRNAKVKHHLEALEDVQCCKAISRTARLKRSPRGCGNGRELLGEETPGHCLKSGQRAAGMQLFRVSTHAGWTFWWCFKLPPLPSVTSHQCCYT